MLGDQDRGPRGDPALLLLSECPSAARARPELSCCLWQDDAWKLRLRASRCGYGACLGPGVTGIWGPESTCPVVLDQDSQNPGLNFLPQLLC